MGLTDNICIVDDCDKPRVTPFDLCAYHKNRLPEGATETRLSFDQPGYIHITITPPGVGQNINLEEVVSKLECDAYNQGTIREWERVFSRLSDICRWKLERLGAEAGLAEIRPSLAKFKQPSVGPSSDTTV